MRIIAGKHRSRKLKSPKDYAVRPTSDRARGAVFNILGNLINWQEVNFLDVCCGTGAVGIEAISRGAKLAGFVEKSDESLDLLEANLEMLREEDNAKIYRCSARSLPEAEMKFDLVYVDPPYKDGIAEKSLQQLVSKSWLAEDAIIAVELDKNEEIELPDSLKIFDERIYGKAKILFLKSS